MMFNDSSDVFKNGPLNCRSFRFRLLVMQSASARWRRCNETYTRDKRRIKFFSSYFVFIFSLYQVPLQRLVLFYAVTSRVFILSHIHTKIYTCLSTWVGFFSIQVQVDKRLALGVFSRLLFFGNRWRIEQQRVSQCGEGRLRLPSGGGSECAESNRYYRRLHDEHC